MKWIYPMALADFIPPLEVVLTLWIKRFGGWLALGIAFGSLWVGIRRRSLNWPGLILALLLVHPSWFISSTRNSDLYGGLGFLAFFATAAMGGALFCQVLFPSLSRRRFLHWLFATVLVFVIFHEPLDSLLYDFGYFERLRSSQAFVTMVSGVGPYAEIAVVVLLAICLGRLVIERLWRWSQKRFPGKGTAWLEGEPNVSKRLCIGHRCRAAIILAFVFVIGYHISVLFWRAGAFYALGFGSRIVFVLLILAVLRRILPDL